MVGVVDLYTNQSCKPELYIDLRKNILCVILCRVQKYPIQQFMTFKKFSIRQFYAFFDTSDTKLCIGCLYQFLMFSRHLTQLIYIYIFDTSYVQINIYIRCTYQFPMLSRYLSYHLCCPESGMCCTCVQDRIGMCTFSV